MSVGFTHVQPGDTVVRLLAERVEMELLVDKVDEQLIHCGAWTFDRVTGIEEDEELGWGVKFGASGSRLIESTSDGM